MDRITVKTTVNAPVKTVWNCWTDPDHITQWNFATDDWQCPNAVNHLQPGGRFSWRMEAKDGSMAFDYAGTYNSVSALQQIEKTLDDGRKVKITFSERDGQTEIAEEFEPENMNAPQLQQQGWQAILDSFKKHVETL